MVELEDMQKTGDIYPFVVGKRSHGTSNTSDFSGYNKHTGIRERLVRG